MHGVLSDSPGVKGKLFGLLSKAWKHGRAQSMDRLVEGAGACSGSTERGVRRILEMRLPTKQPYHLEDITGYDPFDRNAEPDPEIWPAPVARMLNKVLGTDYPERERRSEQDLGRGDSFSP